MVYREPHLNNKSNECSILWKKWYKIFQDTERRNLPERKELRDKWCKCCIELGEMVSQEVKTNPRYIGRKLP